MIVRSMMKSLQSHALLVEHALSENSRDRSQELLNQKIDAELRPIYESWRALWNAQQQAESRLGQLVAQRNAADEAWDQAIRSIGRTLHDTTGNDPIVRRLYLPEGKLDVLSLPLDRQILAMDAYTSVIAGAPSEHLPTGVKERYAAALKAAQDALAVADAGHRAVRDARTARESLDPELVSAYKSYHQSVEYVCGNNRDKILAWIREWPARRTTAPTTEVAQPPSA